MVEAKTTQNKFDRYYIGLDIGTSSVGWAVTDFDYRILRYKGKDMWGVHLFDEASTAQDRRMFRCARRRRERQVNRIAWLRELLQPEIDKIDAGFFDRLEESKLHREDRSVDQPNSLFNDENYTDRDYHHEFPTVYHLRKALMEDRERKFDIRLIYLAISHILKSRGNFLFQGATFNAGGEFANLYARFAAAMNGVLGKTLDCAENAFKDAMMKKGIMAKSEAIGLLIGKEKQMKAVAKMLSGGQAKLSEIFAESTRDDLPYDEETIETIKTAEEEELKNFQFSKADYDEVAAPKIESLLGDDLFELIDAAKAVYDWSVLVNILGSHDSLSSAMVDRTKQHRHQLQQLKALVRKFVPEKFHAFFKERNSADNYQAWIGNSVAKNNKSVCGQEDFYKAIKKLFADSDDAQNSAAYKLIDDEMKAFSYLSKLRIGSNGVIPYQVHLKELEQILENASRHYAIFNEIDDDGISVKDKIKGLLTFRIPYYVGPLSDRNLAKLDRHNSDDTCDKKYDEEHGHAWIVRNEGYERTPIRPWNFDKVVALDKCAENFILRMTEYCTYLPTCRVLPKSSLLYTQFTVYNQLNNLKINDNDLSRERKKYLVELCKEKESVTKKLIAQALDVKTDELSGFDGDLKLSLKSYHDFKRILGAEAMELDGVKKFVEDCIFAITIFGDEKKQLRKRIANLAREYSISRDGNIDAVVNEICKLKYKDWGRFSREFLTEIEGCSNKTGEYLNIIQALEEGSDNLMQLLANDKYTFTEQIIAYNQTHGKNSSKFDYESLVKPLYCSPAVKRSIWRTLVIVKDILRVTKTPPTRIFVEMARDDANKKKENKGKRTVSRNTQIDQLYKAMKSEKGISSDIKAALESLGEKLKNYTDEQLRKSKDRLFLYFIQMGKCMYSGQNIDLDKLLGDKMGTIYDIDHIYPQSKVVDNSLDNRVLVLKTLNHKKGDKSLPDCDFVTKEARDLWKTLRKGNLISKEKYDRLTRTKPLTSAELAGFVNRQLVETRQATKAVCETLKNVFEKSDENGTKTTRVVYSHAGAVSQFRKCFGFGKCRDLNDYHHAKDAYLNVVVGNVWFARFTGINKNTGKMKQAIEAFDEGVNVQLVTDNRTGILDSVIEEWEPRINQYIKAWIPGKSLKTVKEEMASSRILFTRYAFENKGGFYDQQPLKASFCKTPKIPLKMNTPCYHDYTKYGGYDNDKGAYFILVDHIEKKKHVRSFEYVPVRLANAIERNPNRLMQYCTDQPPMGLGLDKPRILVKKVLINSKFLKDGFPFTISGRGGSSFGIRHCAQLVLAPEQEKYLKLVLKYIDGDTSVVINESNEPESPETGTSNTKVKLKLTLNGNIELYDTFIKKHKETIYSKRPSSQCDTLIKGRDKFVNLSLLEQCKVLKNVLVLFSCSTKGMTDLSLIGGSKNAGSMGFSMNITKLTSLLMVHESPTGLTSQTIDLMKL